MVRYVVTNIVIVGVGGQGVLTLAKWIGEAALVEGFDVRIAEVHGMSQRGGSVEVHVRYGSEIYSPIVEEGDADVVIALEALEALRGLRYVKHDGVLVINRRLIPLPNVRLSLDEVIKTIEKSGARYLVIPAFEIALKLGSPIYENSVTLGFVCALLGLPMPPGLDDKNQTAFRTGVSIYNSSAFY
ncbi:MAG: indolepyruvate oxidoreductase subunit beta [Pyrobaculum sp.]